MLYFLPFIVLVATLFASTTESDINRFSWIDGTWQNTRTGDFEQWWFNAELSQWDGRGFKVANGDTVTTEKLTITCIESACEYIAEVGHNQNPIHFKMTTVTENGFESENPEHDFPQFINYEYTDSSAMVATIGAGERKISFPFKKVTTE